MVAGTQPVSLTWAKVGGGALPASAREDDDGVLVIPAAQVEHAGRYRCVGTNQAGSSEDVSELRVQRAGKLQSYPVSITSRVTSEETPVLELHAVLLNPIPRTKKGHTLCVLTLENID